MYFKTLKNQNIKNDPKNPIWFTVKLKNVLLNRKSNTLNLFVLKKWTWRMAHSVILTIRKISYDPQSDRLSQIEILLDNSQLSPVPLLKYAR